MVDMKIYRFHLSLRVVRIPPTILGLFGTQLLIDDSHENFLGQKIGHLYVLYPNS